MSVKYEFINEDILQERKDLPWVEKYRPDLINNIVSHKNILRILKNLIEKEKFPHTIFYGPPGTGKTTAILSCCKKMFGDSMRHMVLELNGSDDRGIKIVRDQINYFAQNNNLDNDIFNTCKKKQKIVILDEADSMTFDAQFALRSVIEQYTKTTRFCLICNYSTKIINAIQSRCSVFRFPPIPDKNHMTHLKLIINHEKMNVDENVINDIIKLSSGDMRRSINTLQSLFMVHKNNNIDLNMLYTNICFPLPDELKSIIDNIFSMKMRQSFQYAKDIENEKSLNINDILNSVVEYIIINKPYGIAKTAKVLLQLSTIEYNLSGNTNTYIQLGAIISALK